MPLANSQDNADGEYQTNLSNNLSGFVGAYPPDVISPGAIPRAGQYGLGAAAEFIDYASAEQAFMAVQMLAFELQDEALQDELENLALALENDERYRPGRFSRLLRMLATGE